MRDKEEGDSEREGGQKEKEGREAPGCKRISRCGEAGT